MSVSASAAFALTMPRGYRLLRFVQRTNHAVVLVLFDKHPRTRGGLTQTCISFRQFWRLNGKCQGWSRGRGRHEWANWFNKHRTDRWCSGTKTQGEKKKRTKERKKKKEETTKKVIRARRPTSEEKNGRESPWWKVVVHHSSQISRPENIFKYNRNSNNTTVSECWSLSLSWSVTVSVGWNQSQLALTEVKKLRFKTGKRGGWVG